jgi:nucleoside-diphosphate kinase
MVIVKPDAVNRALIGDVISRFEKKGLKVVGLKMEHLSEEILKAHYAHHAKKPFFEGLKKFMQKAPAVLMVLEGNEAVEVVRHMAGETAATKALPGTIRGDLALSMQSNIVHASDSAETAKEEIKRFFKKEELHSYTKIDSDVLYAEDEKK